MYYVTTWYVNNVVNFLLSLYLCHQPSAFTSLVKVDAANGVGGASVKRVMEEVKSDLVTVRLYNNGSGVLNDRVRWKMCALHFVGLSCVHLLMAGPPSSTVAVWSGLREDRTDRSERGGVSIR